MSFQQIGDNASSPVQAVQEVASTPAVDPRQKALALGLEFCKRAFEAKTLDDLYLLLTNDVRGLVEFDRSSLVVHLGGKSRFVAAGLQPVLEKKSKFYEEINELAQSLKGVQRGLLLSSKTGAAALSEEELSEGARAAIQSYLDFSGASYLFCAPLNHDGKAVGHLILEFLEAKIPSEISVLTLLNISQFLGAALADKWLMASKPGLVTILDPEAQMSKRRRKRMRFALIALVTLFVVVCVFLFVPVPFDVGGEAEIVPTTRHVAFCKIDGLVQEIKVHEGSMVETGQVLATLDPKDLDYKMKTAKRQFEILTSEMDLLKRAGGEDPSKLAESELVKLKRRAAWEEFQYYQWQHQFLEIKAPISGIVLTKDIESLSGKKFLAGEALCEIVARTDLSVDILVPEDKITYVKTGDRATLYLSGSPRAGYDLSVKEIAPMAEALPRLGNVFRVRAPFPEAPPSTMVGMRGIGKIHAMDSTLWFIVSTRLLAQWQKLALYF
jgi:multidrug resistance efflux pump